jgi:hypothetical protein
MTWDDAHTFIWITKSSYRKPLYWFCSKCGLTVERDDMPASRTGGMGR